MHILFVGINYEPEHTGIAPYTTDLAEYLVSCGDRVTVITGMPHYPEWRVHSAYMRRFRMRETLNHVQLQRVRQYTPANQTAAGRSLYEMTFFVQALMQRLIPRLDRVVGVVPSLGGAAAAAIHARRHTTPLGLVFQDLVGAAASQSGVPGGRWAAGPARALERWVVRQASGIAIVSDAFRPYLERVGAPSSRIVTLPNWSHGGAPSGRADQVRQALGWTPEVKIVLHAGNMGYKQDLDNVIRAAKLAENADNRICFVLMGDGNERDRLEASAVGCKNVHFLAARSTEDFMDTLAAADVLLVNERATVRDMSLPSKITSYFRAGRPVVAAVPPTGSTAAELSMSGGAIVVDASDPAKLLDGIQQVLADSSLASGLVDRARNYSETRLDRQVLLRSAREFIRNLN